MILLKILLFHQYRNYTISLFLYTIGMLHVKGNYTVFTGLLHGTSCLFTEFLYSLVFYDYLQFVQILEITWFLFHGLVKKLHSR